ncbi:hypothetical protein A2870_00320 [Candidatus Curtissbacteria bacterium RIFCSPHIGHO2_01_FULL_41_11]|uniref:Aspartate--tRNA(Asp/Asn) ligase n=1 Tax=Candidatus Curtissbacteria bacterium RIFCSPHIGHO2_01_FULL_41_11 TaxID=1797711 RepID=A0A1F5G4X7_9BACT|nr:MAG: hypothetical protein A2870_00320 [Candidatus Curtissbacteria bacterium RIFCSPHIGHO2_01_FULL_41_11]
MNRTLAVHANGLIGKKVTLFGWVDTIRDHGKISFLDIKDSSGVIQTVAKKQYDVSPQDVVKIQGTVKKRPENLINKNLPTGEIEVEIENLEIYSKAQTPPIPTEGDGYDIEENLRLKFRYLDLRRQRLQKNLKIRHEIAKLFRAYLNGQDFIEIETPYLSQTTPEGSRDFLVPSRLQPGKFYALTQSPQQYKQLLMVAGFEKYYQFARAFRDEDLRADRGFEHTQVDIEMAFIEREDIMKLIEDMYKSTAKSLGKKVLKDPFPIFTYEEAMKKFKADKFDLRNPSADGKNDDVLAFAWVVDFPLLEYDEKEKHYTFSHNPFCAPKEEDVANLMASKNLDKLLSYQYDLVLNGEEIAGGSIRITKPQIQRQVFKVMGYTDEKIEKDFSHLLNAYKYGAPPHGGIALGLDRFAAIIAGEKSIREVIAFPMTGSGQTAVMDAPSAADPQTLKELKLKVS